MLLDVLLQLLVLLGLLPCLSLRFHLVNLLLSIYSSGLLGDAHHAYGGADGILIAVDAILHVDHLEVGVEGELTHGVKVEVELVLVDLIEMPLDVVVVLEGQPEVTLPQVGGT